MLVLRQLIAGVLVAIVPVVAVFMLAERFVVQRLTVGAVND